jgi:hypothetical protein
MNACSAATKRYTIRQLGAAKKSGVASLAETVAPSGPFG